MSETPPPSPGNTSLTPESPVSTSPTALPAVPLPKGGFARASFAARLVPFIPILLALVVAFAARYFMTSAPPMKEKDLIGTKAPDFSLRDAHKEESDDPVTLSLLADKGPVVIVFYRGYGCSRCMGHLALIGGQIEDYEQAGVQVLAISPDTPANTKDSIATFQQDFPFPLLSDRDNKVARAYGLLAADGSFLHGVFVIDRERRIQFAAKTDEPYGDAAMLLEIAKKWRKTP